jgi:hypothetical protein
MNSSFDLSAFGTLQQNPTSLYDLSHFDAQPKEEENAPQIQEQYSNPTNWPGFSSLPKEEQMQKIAFSQFDPANQSPTGGYVTPGQYESKSQRLAASIIPTLMVPESNLGSGAGNIH